MSDIVLNASHAFSLLILTHHLVGQVLPMRKLRLRDVNNLFKVTQPRRGRAGTVNPANSSEPTLGSCRTGRSRST